MDFHLLIFVYKQKIANVRNKVSAAQAYRPSGLHNTQILLI